LFGLEVYTSYHHIYSPLGLSSEENYDAVLAHQSGVKKQVYGKLQEEFFLSKIPETSIEKIREEVYSAQLYTDIEILSTRSLEIVLKKANLKLSDPQTLLILASTKGNIGVLDRNLSAQRDEHRAYLWAYAEVLTQNLNCHHTPMVISNACISGLLAILVAQRLLSRGKFKHVFVCGADVISEFVVSGFKSFNALSGEPCMPFDKNRSGINLGEAVATLYMTSDPAQKSADSALVVNGASSNDANHISGPSRSGEGLLQAIRRTMKGKDVLPDFINAHGTATLYNDDMESLAFETCGFSEVPVNSLKGNYGHTLGAAGVLETIISLQAFAQQQLIATKGFHESGLAGHIQVAKKNAQYPMKTFLKTASGFGGCNASVLFAKCT
jgi:3-oxoacyl-[acyl-carrier-protein] synthase-1